MKTKLIDTNIIIRFLVEENTNPKYSCIFELFEKVEAKEEYVFIDNIVILEAYFVLTKVYKVPNNTAINSLEEIISFSGVKMENKTLIISTFERLLKKKVDFADAYLIERALLRDMLIYTNDKDLLKSEAKTQSL